MSNPILKWPDERKEALKEMYARGLSASQTAAELNCGITRNAVIGMWHRLKLERRGVTAGIRKSVKVKPHGPPKPPRKHRRTNIFATRWGAYDVETKPGILPPEPVVDVVPLHLSFDDLSRTTCRWPYGDGPEFSFCGCDPMQGRQYCLAHHNISIGAGTSSERSAARDLLRAA